MKRPVAGRGQAELAQIGQLLATQQIDAAEGRLRGFLARTPLSADGWRLMGQIRYGRGDYRSAFEAFQQSLACRVSPDILMAMAEAAEKLGAHDTVESCMQQVLKLDPRSGEAWYRLAIAQEAQGAAPERVVASLEKAIALNTHPDSSYTLIAHVAHNRMNDRDLARAAYQQALDVNPVFLPALLGMGQLFWTNHHVEEAMQLFQRALAAGADPAKVYHGMSASLLTLGRHEECLAAYREALAVSPDDLVLLSDYLFATNYSSLLSDQAWLAEHRRFGERVARFMPATREYPECVPDPDRVLRIGYVSGDLRDHPVTNFFEPLLLGHDRQRFSVYCYANFPRDDHISVRLKTEADVWRDVYKLSDEQLAQQIREDRIDVLVDLSGHTAYHRLAVFARAPAPVQVTWLGYGPTTGMATMDYAFTDRHFCPDAAAESLFVEKVVRMPVYRVFRPGAELELRPLPALKNGYITFGSFNNFIKLNIEVLDLWARLLCRVPDSRLAIIVGARESVDYVKHQFAERGVDPERLMIYNRLDMSRFLQLHWHVDLALDPFPFNGATTSFIGMWMGVPMITMAGSKVGARTGVSLLGPLGLDEFIAHSPEDYIERASYWAAHPERLAEIRTGLRDRLRQSPLMDEAAFCRSFEQTLRDCFRRWCERSPSVSG